MLIESVTVGNGKYTVTNENGKLTALRNGEPWNRDLVGDNLVYWMMVRIQELEAAVSDSSSRYAASAEEYLRSRYGAYKAHHEWRSLEESFIAGAIHSSRAVAEAAVKDAVGGEDPPFRFDRYVNGIKMAEGLTIERQQSLGSAMIEATRIAPRGPNGEAPVLVYTRPQASQLNLDYLREMGRLEARIRELEQASAAVPEGWKLSVFSLTEAARCLGVAQERNDSASIDHWSRESQKYEREMLSASQPEVKE